MDPRQIPLARMMQEAGQEIGMRKKVYPGWIANGRYTQEKADEKIAAMQAIYGTLKALSQDEELAARVEAIRQAYAP